LGENTIDFHMITPGGRFNALMYDTIILESD